MNMLGKVKVEKGLYKKRNTQKRLFDRLKKDME